MARGRKKKTETRKLNITVMVLIVLSIVLGVLIYAKGGYLGDNLSPALGGVLGFVKYAIPVAIFVISLYMAHQKDTKYYIQKLIMFFAVLLLIECVMSCYLFSEGTLNANDDATNLFKRAFDLGTKNIGGGVVGAAIAYAMIRFIGIPGTVIASLGICAILIVFIFGLHPAEYISRYLDKVDGKREQLRKQKEKDKKTMSSSKIVEEVPKNNIFTKFLENKEKKAAEKAKAKDLQDDQITINIDDNKSKAGKEKGIDVPNFKGFGRKPVPTADDLFEEKEKEKQEAKEQVLNLEHARTEAELNYEFPPITLLQKGSGSDDGNSKKVLLATAEKLRRTLYSFGVSAKVENVTVGPAITRYELAPAEGVRVSKIANLADDIALSLEAETIRIEAPIPGKHTVGIEVPNKKTSVVALRDIIESEEFINSKSKVTFALGKDVAGDICITDIAKMPHLLIAGSTGSGKSVCINTLITSIIYKAKPSEVKLLMIDPKVVELSVYNGIPHLLIPVVTDPKKAAGALTWAVQEMVNRYGLFAGKGVRDIKGYNEAAQKSGEPKLPQMVIIIDELADLMVVAAKEVEDAIQRLAQMARAAGMHLVIATQRPSVDVITGTIKSNIASRIAFAVASQVDSRTILDGSGAEKLLGKGDMLFAPLGSNKPTRIQGAFVDDKEVENIVKFIKQDNYTYDETITEKIEEINKPKDDKKGSSDDLDDDGIDPLLNDAIEVVIASNTASASFIQRKFKVGYARAGRIIDQMEERGIVSGYSGSKPREVIMTKERWEELKMAPEGSTYNSNSEDEESKSI